MLFTKKVPDPHRFGVPVYVNGKVIDIIEKPKNPSTDRAVVGLYCYSSNVFEVIEGLQPSARGEYEITDINCEYLRQKKLSVKVFNRGTAWLDTGTFDSLLQAAQFVQIIETRHGFKVGCIEEIAWRKKFINNQQLDVLAAHNSNSDYGVYLKKLLSE